MLYGDRILRANVDIATGRPDGIGGNEHPLDHTMGVTLEHGAVHKGPRVPLVSVAYYIFGVTGGLTGETPLPSSGEACTPATAQFRLRNRLDHLLRAHPRQRLSQGCIAIPGDVVPDVFRVNLAAVTKHLPRLVHIERDQFGTGQHIAVVAVQQPLHQLPLQQRPRDDFRDILGGYFLVEYPVRVYGHHRGLGAETLTPGIPHLYAILQTMLFDLRQHFIPHIEGTMSAAPRGAYPDTSPPFFPVIDERLAI